MKKITICGVTASGKTTLANKLGAAFNIPVYHLDKIFWTKYGHLSQPEFIQKVAEIVQQPSWIIDGSNPRSKTFDMRIASADTIIFYDLPLLVVLYRQTKRFFMWYGKVRPDMGGGNKQKYPFTWKEVEHALQYPTKELYSKILPYKENKTIIIIKNTRDEKAFVKKILLNKNHPHN